MERWTTKTLDGTDDLLFAVSILNERANKLNPHAPLCKKLKSAAHTINRLWEMKRDAKPAKDHTSQELVGGYVLISTYASSLSEAAESESQCEDERPTAVLAIKKEFLESWGKPEFSSLKELLDTYTYDDIETLASDAAQAGALGFEYRFSTEPAFSFPNTCTGEAMTAFADYLSGKLQENGHTEASKYLDCLLSL